LQNGFDTLATPDFFIHVNHSGVGEPVPWAWACF